MFPQQLSSFQFYQKKKDIILYKAHDHSRNYILKCIIPKDDAVKQAFYDEYLTFSTLLYPSIPIYYGITEEFCLPKDSKEYLTLCMEDCSFHQLPDSTRYSLSDLIPILLKTGETLLFLLKNGVLYTDLNPSNLLIRKEKNTFHITLLDYTYCYYYLRNPHPDYPLRFSYNLSPELRGQQLLIQELTYLFHEFLDKNEIINLPYRVCLLLETGRNPARTLSLEAFLLMLKECLI